MDVEAHPCIHPTAIVAPQVRIGAAVEIGPYCVVGPDVSLDDGVRLLSHVSIAGHTEVGARTVVYPFAALGHPPQDKKYKGEPTRLVIGSDNIIREQATFHTGTPTGRGETVVGNGGYFMVGAHVGHDCIVGHGVTFANNATLGGMVTIEDGVILGGLSAVHQFGRVGRNAMVGGGAPLVGDVIPYGIVDNHGRLAGLNLIGLKRRGVPRETIHALRAIYRTLFEGEGQFEARYAEVRAAHAGLAEAQHIFAFIEAGEKRGLCRPGDR
jgi:UDP-N-acetylglucosamine acyltransferase